MPTWTDRAKEKMGDTIVDGVEASVGRRIKEFWEEAKEPVIEMACAALLFRISFGLVGKVCAPKQHIYIHIV